jgi:uncharacterized protein
MRLRRLLPAGLAMALLGGCSGAPMDLNVQHYQGLKYATTVRQVLDFTCGGAALATMLTHYWGRPTTETEILEIFRARYPDPKIWQMKIKDGFTFDDIVFAAEVLGYEAAGAKVAIDELAAMNGPVIIHLDKGTFQHFVVLKKAHAGVFYMSDPIVGKLALERPDFEKQYTGSAMAIWRDGRPLPANAPLARIRDGITVRSTLRERNPVEAPVLNRSF